MFSAVVLGIFITPVLGMGKSYNTMLVKDGVAYFIWIRCLILLTFTLVSFGLLYLLGKFCKRTTTKKTYMVMLIILLLIATFATISFLDGNLWSYPPETI